MSTTSVNINGIVIELNSDEWMCVPTYQIHMDINIPGHPVYTGHLLDLSRAVIDWGDQPTRVPDGYNVTPTEVDTIVRYEGYTYRFMTDETNYPGHIFCIVCFTKDEGEMYWPDENEVWNDIPCLAFVIDPANKWVGYIIEE